MAASSNVPETGDGEAGFRVFEQAGDLDDKKTSVCGGRRVFGSR
jgi:hypothetical protein